MQAIQEKVTYPTGIYSSGVGRISVRAIGPLPDAPNLKGYADVNYAGVLLRDFRIMKGPRGLFVAPPSVKGKDEKWHNYFQFYDPELRLRINTAVLREFSNVRPRESTPTSLDFSTQPTLPPLSMTEQPLIGEDGVPF